jgi:hypothetical protein
LEKKMMKACGGWSWCVLGRGRGQELALLPLCGGWKEWHSTFCIFLKNKNKNSE